MGARAVQGGMSIPLPPIHFADEEENQVCACLIEKISRYFSSTLLALPGGNKKGSPFSKKILQKGKTGQLPTFSLKKELVDFLALHENKGQDLIDHLEKGRKKHRVELTDEEFEILQSVTQKVQKHPIKVATLKMEKIRFEKNSLKGVCKISFGDKVERFTIDCLTLCMFEETDVATWKSPGGYYRLFAKGKKREGIQRRFEDDLKYLLLKEKKALEGVEKGFVTKTSEKKLNAIKRAFLLIEGRRKAFPSNPSEGQRYNGGKLEEKIDFSPSTLPSLDFTKKAFLKRKELTVCNKTFFLTQKVYRAKRFLILGTLASLIVLGSLFLSKTFAVKGEQIGSSLGVGLLKEGGIYLSKISAFSLKRAQEITAIGVIALSSVCLLHAILPKRIASLERKIYRI